MTLEDFGVKRQETTLSNGARLVLFQKKGAPHYLRAIFFAGSRFDPFGKEGAAHFLEHLIVAGTKNFRTKDKLASYIEKFGGIFNASTSADSFDLNVAVGDPSDFDRIVELFHEMLLEPLFDEKIIETERGSIFSEIGNMKSNPGSMIWEVWRNILFQDTVSGRSILGSEKSVGSIVRKDIIDFYNRRIVNGKMVFIASGGVKINDLKKELENKALVRGLRERLSIEDLPVIREKNLLIEKYSGSNQIHLAFGFRSSSESHHDGPALDLLATVVGGGRASLLQRKLRYETGLVYSVNARQQSFCDSGSWVIKTSTSKSKFNEVLNVIVLELKRIQHFGLSREELEFAQDKIEKSKRMDMQTSGSWVGFHSLRELFRHDEVWTLSDYISEIRSVTPEKILTAAQKYFGSDKWYLAACGDIEESDIKVDW